MAAEFSRRTEALLNRAEAICEHRGANLTELRRHVLGMILDAASPTGAYDLLDRLRQTRRSAAPPTVYRTLDFLLEQGLIHRVERLSAFVGCVAGCTVDPDGVSHTHAAQFLICRKCGRVVEMQDHDVSTVLARVAKEAGFSISNATIEAEGLCSTCRTAAPSRARHGANG
ncbi:MAG TPA: transcriptional repressor [Acetobacteraceae bacterium]|jgi:Fur family zinc uptake transcriptional regulator|nr:transcriptional repressor [Acetobacteraceae bacterium]